MSNDTVLSKLENARAVVLMNSSGRTNSEIAQSLGLSARQVQRLKKALLEDGSAGLAHGTHFTPVAPTCVSVTPSTGKVQTGAAQLFSAEYGNANGRADIYLCYMQISQTSSQANDVLVNYDAKLNKVFLKNDANSHPSPTPQ